MQLVDSGSVVVVELLWWVLNSLENKGERLRREK